MTWESIEDLLRDPPKPFRPPPSAVAVAAVAYTLSGVVGGPFRRYRALSAAVLDGWAEDWIRSRVASGDLTPTRKAP